jgi:hypothetical protein
MQDLHGSDSIPGVDTSDANVTRFGAGRRLAERGRERARELGAGGRRTLNGISETAGELVGTREKRNAAYVVLAVSFVVGVVSGLFTARRACD